MNRAAWRAIRAEVEHGGGTWRTWAVLLFDCAAGAAACWLHARAGWYALAAVPVFALVLLHAYLLVHEASHNAVAAGRRLNDAVGQACAWLVAMPYMARRRSHLLHHTWAGHPYGDPANRRLIARFAVMTQEQARALERIWRSWMPLMVINDRLGLWREPFASGDPRLRGERRIARVQLLSYAAAAGLLGANGHGAALWQLYLPALLLAFVLEEIANLPHHAGTPLLQAQDEALRLWEQHRVTHSCRSVPFWSRYVLLNFNLHTAHHLFPTLPWHRLPCAQRRIALHLPDFDHAHVTEPELPWTLRHRKRPLLDLMGHYFDRLPDGGERKHALRSQDLPR